MTRRHFSATALVLLGLSLLSAKKPPKAVNAISMVASDWTIDQDVRVHPIQVGSGWYVDIPQLLEPLDVCRANYRCPVIGYLTTPKPSLAGKSLLSMRVQITVTGAPIFNYKFEDSNVCENPASVRLLLEVAHDDYVSDFGRWWSNPLHVDLAEGFAELNVPLSPDQWSSVFGHAANSSVEAQAAFQSVVNHTGTIGMTFGGGCFFSHGVDVSGGTARFTVQDFSAH